MNIFSSFLVIRLVNLSSDLFCLFPDTKIAQEFTIRYSGLGQPSTNYGETCANGTNSMLVDDARFTSRGPNSSSDWANIISCIPIFYEKHTANVEINSIRTKKICVFLRKTELRSYRFTEFGRCGNTKIWNYKATDRMSSYKKRVCQNVVQEKDISNRFDFGCIYPTKRISTTMKIREIFTLHSITNIHFDTPSKSKRTLALRACFRSEMLKQAWHFSHKFSLCLYVFCYLCLFGHRR